MATKKSNDMNDFKIIFQHDSDKRIHDRYIPGQFCHTLAPGKGLIDKDYDREKSFALVDGVRVKDQMCLSDEGTYQHVRSNVIALHEMFPNRIISISQEDNLHWCECNECKLIEQEEGSKSGVLVRFLTRLAAEFWYIWFQTLIYRQTEIPCKSYFQDNVEVWYPLINDGQKLSRKTKERIVKWQSKAAKGQFAIWYYGTNLAHTLMPYPNLRYMFDNLVWFNELGINIQLVQGNFGIGHNFADIRLTLINYVFIKGHWYNRFINGILPHWYVDDWKIVRKYIRLMELAQRICRTRLYHYNSPQNYSKGYLSPLMLNWYERIIKTIEHHTVRSTLLMGINYTRIELGIATKKQMNQFADTCTELGNVTVNERHEQWDDYLVRKGWIPY